MPRFLLSARPERPDAAAPRAAIPFPHADAIQSATGVAVPGSAVYDPEACRRRGVPAFTDGTVTHFGTPAPVLPVAAHEAAHQLQHAGATRDAGMGPEAHAQSVAHLVAAGASPRGLLGARGRAVAPALRHYTDFPAAAAAGTGQWSIGSDARVADNGQMVTSVTDRHKAFADPALIEAADLVLRAKQSGVRLRAGAAGPSGPAPDGSGNKSTVEVVPQVRTMTAGGEVWTDCGRMSREVQGATGTDTPARGFYRDGGGTERETTAGAPTRIRDEALVGAGLGTDAASARAAYHAMDPAARDAFDQAHGINRYAAPGVGESFMSVRNDAMTTLGYNFHWGGVVMVAGGDRVTFENFARLGTGYGTQNVLWYFDMYGPPTRAGQTWHDRWAEGGGREGTGVGAPGMESMTIPTRTSADPSPFTPGTPALRTGELIRRRGAAGSDGEKMALDAELATRWIKVLVQVVTAQEGTDEVYVRAEHGGKSRETGALDMGSGDRNTFWLPLSALMPVTGKIHIKVYDSDLAFDDMISIFWLEDAPASDNRPWDGAEYHVTAEFDR
ncbi:MAG TPA: hypothetical protein VFQ45_20630 [Longimicrobium sp.]|nr:hypothetical protein [Longimicrobium sp.]